MNHEEWLERAEIYALGALDGAELRDFEAHLASGCAECEERLRDSREALAQAAESLAPFAPPPSVKTALLGRIGAESPAPAGERRFRWSWPVGVGALATAGLVLLLSWQLIDTRRKLEDAQSRLGVVESEKAQNKEVMDFLSNPQVRVVNLTGVPPTSGGKAQLLWDPVARKGILLTIGLSQTPAEKAYELWGLSGSEAVPAGVFTVNEQGRVVFRLPTLPESKPFDKFAVTLEPMGGVPKATGPVVLVGNL
ncbi:MAG TPA: anti-sigma factor [Candidatus Binatia bacterium]|nr:anti-sigma factor [Candidatus Binatia bacterium]